MTWHFFMIKDFISSFNNGVKILISSVLKFSQFGVWKTRLITFFSFFSFFIFWKSSRGLRSSPDGKLKWNTSTCWSSYTQKEYICMPLSGTSFFFLSHPNLNFKNIFGSVWNNFSSCTFRKYGFSQSWNNQFLRHSFKYVDILDLHFYNLRISGN